MSLTNEVGAPLEAVNMRTANQVVVSNGRSELLMAVPPLRNGLLPPGVYPASFAEVGAAFDQVQSRTRQTLNQALEHAATLIWSKDPTAAIYVNGSYVTDKTDLVDVDLAVRSDIWDDTLFLAEFAQLYPGEVSLVDSFFNSTQSPQHMENLFQEVQGSSTHKGIIRLLP